MFFYGTHETANLKSDEMWPYNPETRAKFATMKNMKKEGYQEGLLEIEEKHQNAAVEAMEEVAHRCTIFLCTWDGKYSTGW